jgi:signal transduction histidine kinase
VSALTERLRAGSLRNRLSWSATLVVALWVLVVAVVGNVLLAAMLAREADGVLLARAEASAATLRIEPSGVVHVIEPQSDQALDVGTWIFARDGAVVDQPPGSSAQLDQQAAALAGKGLRAVDAGLTAPVRLLALPVRVGTRQMATVVTTTSLAPYQQVQRLTVVGTIAAAALLLLVVHLVLRVNVSRALRPVQQMSAQAARWSADDIDRRFGPTPRPAELAALAETFDGVLNRLSAVVRHEQQLSAELSHELRTPLARIRSELDWVADRPRDATQLAGAHGAIAAATEAMSEILETLMTTARSGAGTAPGRCSALEVVGRAGERLRQLRPGLDVTVDVPSELVAGVDAVVLDRLLGPVLDNAARYAEHRISVTGRAPAGDVVLTVSDDGPGLPPDSASRVFEPGWRGNPADGHDGAGLGLALAVRLATAVRGSLTARPDGPGATFDVRLPAG